MAGGATDESEDAITGINVTPLVDITLVLLIIFMVTAKIIVSQSVPLDLPKAASGTDVQTVFSDKLCIECDACVDICPMDCITFTANGDEADLRTRLTAPAINADQALYVSAPVRTGRVMVKDEDVCLHCGLCAERCPTGAWDMQKFLLVTTKAGPRCRDTQSPRERAGAAA